MKKAGYFVFALLALSIFLVGLVAAAETDAPSATSKTNADVVSGFFSNMFSKISTIFSGVSDRDFFEPSDFVLKLLIFFLVAIVIYSISGFLPFVEKNKYTTWALTLIVAYLSTYALLIEEIKLLLVSYTALAMVITGIIPFFAIAAISKKNYDHGKPSFASKAIWIVFIVFFVYKWLFSEANNKFGFLTLALLIAALIMLFVEGSIWRLFNKSKAKASARSGVSVVSVTKRRRLLEDLRDAESELINLAHQKGKEKEMADLTDEIARLKGLIAGSKKPIYD